VTTYNNPQLIKATVPLVSSVVQPIRHSPHVAMRGKIVDYIEKTQTLAKAVV
jgi:hypothetical protein